MNDAERYQLFFQRLLAHHGSAHVKKSQVDLPQSQFFAQSYFMDYRASHGDITTAGMAVSADGTFSNLPTAETNARSYGGHVSDGYLKPAYHNPKAKKASNTCLQTPLRKRKIPSLDEIIRETWELHSLHRTGLAASSNVTENRKVCIVPEEDWGRARQNSIMPESKWDKPILQESLPDKSWDVATKSENSDDDMPKVTMDSSGDCKSREEEAFDFFFQIFEESEELKKLFSEQCHAGRFDCLVCSSIPGKKGKKYNALVSLIMHAIKVLKTKKKQEHRGYARALCAAMGWDLCRLPSMPGSSSPHPRCCIPIDEQEASAQLCF